MAVVVLGLADLQQPPAEAGPVQAVPAHDSHRTAEPMCGLPKAPEPMCVTRQAAMPQACDCDAQKAICDCDHHQPAMPMSCGESDQCTCGLEDRKDPGDVANAEIRPLPLFLLALSLPLWQGPANALLPPYESTYRNPFKLSPQRPPWRLG